MNYSKIYKNAVSDGPGIRVSVYASGCRIHCPGCHNAEAQDFAAGDEYTPEVEEYIIGLLSKQHIRGLTIAGGEPTEPENAEVLARLAERAKSMGKDVWAYTGRSFKELIPGGHSSSDAVMRLLRATDVLVSEPFVLAERDISNDNPWRGSRNQKLLDMRRSLSEGKEIPVEGIKNAIWPIDARKTKMRK